MILKFATNQDPWPWVWVLFRVSPSLIHSSASPRAVRSLRRSSRDGVRFTILKSSGPPSLNRSHQPEHLVRRRRKRKHKAASEATNSRCEMGTEHLKLEPAARATRVRLCSSGVPLLALRFSFLFFKKTLLFPFTGQKRLSWAASNMQFSCYTSFGFSQINIVMT
jgi:hypothetical protein